MRYTRAQIVPHAHELKLGMQSLLICQWTLLQHSAIRIRLDFPSAAVDGYIKASGRGLLSMCTLILCYKLLENYPIVVAANRDEQYARRARAQPQGTMEARGVLA